MLTYIHCRKRKPEGSLILKFGIPCFALLFSVELYYFLGKNTYLATLHSLTITFLGVTMTDQFDDIKHPDVDDLKRRSCFILYDCTDSLQMSFFSYEKMILLWIAGTMEIICLRRDSHKPISRNWPTKK